LFKIDPTPYRAAIAQAPADVARANAALVNTRQERLRASELFKRKPPVVRSLTSER